MSRQRLENRHASETLAVAIAIFRQFCRAIRNNLRERGDEQALALSMGSRPSRKREMTFRAEARAAIAALDFVRINSKR
jgi:hypothetical protein